MTVIRHKKSIQIISLNLNGLRAAVKKGFAEWLKTQNPDFVCVQEIRIKENDLTENLRNIGSFKGIFHHAERPGYSGVGIYSKKAPDSVTFGCGLPEFDREGRFLQATFGKLTIISLYAPSGSSSEHRLNTKFRFMKLIVPKLKKLKSIQREIIICGDLNVAHKKIDLKNWKSNQKNSGFLPEEREWLTHLIDDLGFMDVFRLLNHKEDQYTWWSNRGQAWNNNVGWRIDYQLATPRIARTANYASIYKDQRFSDHAPLIINYNLNN